MFKLARAHIRKILSQAFLNLDFLGGGKLMSGELRLKFNKSALVGGGVGVIKWLREEGL